jgi:hypothetical protein
VDLQALPRDVLPDQLGVQESHPLAGAQQRLRRPPLAVALQRQEQRRQPRGAQRAAARHAVDRGQRARELLPARAREAADRALDVLVDRAVGLVRREVDLAALVEPRQLARDRLARLRRVRRSGARAEREHAEKRNQRAMSGSSAGHGPMLGSPRRLATCCNPACGRSFRHHRSLFQQ